MFPPASNARCLLAGGARTHRTRRITVEGFDVPEEVRIRVVRTAIRYMQKHCKQMKQPCPTGLAGYDGSSEMMLCIYNSIIVRCYIPYGKARDEYPYSDALKRMVEHVRNVTGISFNEWHVWWFLVSALKKKATWHHPLLKKARTALHVSPFPEEQKLGIYHGLRRTMRSEGKILCEAIAMTGIVEAYAEKLSDSSGIDVTPCDVYRAYRSVQKNSARYKRKGLIL